MQMPMVTRARVLTFVLGGSLVLAACGGGDDGGGDDAGAQPDAPATKAAEGSIITTVTMRDNEYAPADPVVASGKLDLVNEGEAPHTFTVEGEDIDVEVEAGATSTATIDLEPGSYTVFCEFHRSQGMETTLTVE